MILKGQVGQVRRVGQVGRGSGKSVGHLYLSQPGYASLYRCRISRRVRDRRHLDEPFRPREDRIAYLVGDALVSPNADVQPDDTAPAWRAGPQRDHSRPATGRMPL